MGTFYDDVEIGMVLLDGVGEGFKTGVHLGHPASEYSCNCNGPQERSTISIPVNYAIKNFISHFADCWI